MQITQMEGESDNLAEVTPFPLEEYLGLGRGVGSGESGVGED